MIRSALCRVWQHVGMIVLGVILIILGVLLGIGVLTTIGIILAVVGAVLFVLGSAGRSIGGRSHWY